MYVTRRISMEPIDQELLRKYFEGHCTAQEEAYVEQWLSSDRPEEIGEDADLIFKGMDKTALKDQIWMEIAPEKPANAHRWLSLKIAASVVIASLCSFLIYQYLDIWGEQEPATTYKTIEAAPGEKLKITLSDGSEVHLNGGSRLQVPERFSAQDRTVYLSGEAYLQVTRDPSRPFSVVTGHTVVRVLGTIFNVKAYAGDSVTTVVVKEGKVSVTDSTGRQILLLRGEMATWSPSYPHLEKLQADADELTAWTAGILVFKDQSLEEIAVILQRWYGINMVIANPRLKNHRFTGTFAGSPPLISVIRDMALTAQFQYRFNENNLTLY